MEKIHGNTCAESVEVKRVLRSKAELLRSRAGLLAGRDRLLMAMYLGNGNSFRQIARLTGVNEANIARRIQKLTRRLLDGEYIMCLRNRDKFTQGELEIARDYFLLGLSIRRISHKRGLTYYRVRRTVKKIEAVLGAIDEARSRQGERVLARCC